MEASRNLKANLKLEGKPCAACLTAIALGDDATVCTACEAAHHARCWTAYTGCAGKGCVNAPLRRLDAPSYAQAAQPQATAAPPPPLPPGYVRCVCGAGLDPTTPMCPYCRRGMMGAVGPGWGPRPNVPGAVASMVVGIISLFFCGVILGPIAIAQATNARNLLKENPTYGGGGFATAGLVLGIISTSIWGFVLIAQVAR